MRDSSVKSPKQTDDGQFTMDDAQVSPGQTSQKKSSHDRRKKSDGHGSRIIADLPGLRKGSLMQSAASLIWLPQAGLLAYSVQKLANEGRFEDVTLPAIAVLMLGIMRALFDMLGSRTIFRTARHATTRLREQACAALAGRSPLDVHKQPSGMAASIVAEQTEAVLPFLLRFQPVQYKLSIIPIAILLCVGWFSWLAALILMVAAPLIPIFMALIGYRAQKASEAQMIEVGSMNAFLLDRLRGLTSIRSLDAVDITASRFRSSAESLKKRTMAVLRIAFLSSAVLELFSALGIAMVAVYIGFHLLGQIPYGAWGAKLTLGQGLFILLLAPAFFEPLQELSSAWHDRASGKAAIAALDRLSEDRTPLLGALSPTPDLSQPSSSPPSVSLADIRFRYGSASKFVFENFSLSIRPGEKLALLGPSGSGKSTLLAMISGLTPATSGTIRIGDAALDDDTAAQLRQRMAWVGQKPHIFAGTLRSNITLGRSGIGQREIRNALQSASLDNVARSHPGSVGEGGFGLSGGETLRLALARAMVSRQADIILADEPTAHLDSTTAREVADALLVLSQDKTLIVATHDEAFAAHMDRIVRLESLP